MLKSSRDTNDWIMSNRGSIESPKFQDLKVAGPTRWSTQMVLRVCGDGSKVICLIN